ncbi:hypothetical protein KAR91_88190, partial [Candidatus Pacearchaeota archaeon]|nr:hypothetical protein [Candidatus Pacearchaeota archaeon]
MNDTFLIPDRSSLYNIKSIYNALIEEVGKSGLESQLMNGRMDQFVRDQLGVLRVGGWRSSTTLTGPVVTFGNTDWLNCWMSHLEPNTVYTLIVDAENTAELDVNLFGTAGSKVYDFYDNTINPSWVLPVSYDDMTNAERHQTAFTFRTGAYSPGLPPSAGTGDPAILQFTANEPATLTVASLAIIKGTFGFAHRGEKSIFMDSVRIAEDGTNSYYEVSNDAGGSWHRLLTTDPADITALVAASSGEFYTVTQIDNMFLRRDQADTALGKIDFAAGLTSSGPTLIEDNNLRLSKSDIVANVHQTVGSGVPIRNWNLTINRGDEPNTGIRYNEGKNKWEFTHDGYEWKVMGSGEGGGGGGTGSSELEYYAEILTVTGFRYGIYDLFDSIDTANDVFPTNAIYSAERDGHYTAEPAHAGPWILRSPDIWDETSYDGIGYEIFCHTLTNQIDNTGMSVWYALDQTAIPAIDDTNWVAWGHNVITHFPSQITNFHFKFEIDSTDVEFYSYGLFFGMDNKNYTSTTRLREVYTIPSNQAGPTLYTVPNGGAYTNDGKSLELYHNRARILLGVDYNEIDGNTIQMLNPTVLGDSLEYYEKYGYYLDSTTRSQFLSHLVNPDAHDAVNITYDSSNSVFTN